VSNRLELDEKEASPATNGLKAPLTKPLVAPPVSNRLELDEEEASPATNGLAAPRVMKPLIAPPVSNRLELDEKEALPATNVHGGNESAHAEQLGHAQLRTSSAFASTSTEPQVLTVHGLQYQTLPVAVLYQPSRRSIQAHWHRKQSGGLIAFGQVLHLITTIA